VGYRCSEFRSSVITHLNTIISKIRDFFQRIGMRQYGWRSNYPHYHVIEHTVLLLIYYPVIRIPSSVQLNSVFRSKTFIVYVLYGMSFSLDCSMYFVRLNICILLHNSRAFVLGVTCLLPVFHKFLDIGILY
jgi:hypothetical protein